jgi:hypothetical protein
VSGSGIGKIWILVLILYALFSLWYFNWSGPITASEIESYMAAFHNAEGNKHTDAQIFRTFIEQDDGDEFVMLNLVQLHDGDVVHPVSGGPVKPSQLIGEYFVPFSLALLKRGGHPVFQARTLGGNIDSWNAESNVGFGVTAMMRYRSRRDLVELVIDPAFADAHIYKLAAIERTISYPTQIMFSTNLRPPVVVLLMLVLLGSLAQNLIGVLRRR